MSELYCRNLPVPYLSQRENTAIWKERKSQLLPNGKLNPNAGEIKPNGKEVPLAATSCNITCLTMLLQYFGITSETPDQILKNIFEPSGAGEVVSDEVKAVREQTYNDHTRIEYIDFMKDVVLAFYPEAKVITSNEKKGLDYVERHVANGFPVMISCGIARRYTESYYANLLTIDDEEIRIIKNEYRKRYSSNYDKDLSEAEKELENASDKEKTQAQHKVDEIEARYEQEKQKRLTWYLEYYRHRGHYIVIRGFTEDSVIINDPWGSPINNQGNIQMAGDRMGQGFYSFSPFGDNIKISREQFNLQYNENIWTTFVIYHYRWGFVFNNNTIPKGVKPTEEILEDCYKQETFSYGGFPMKRSNLWHNGIHLQTGGDVMVYPMGPGQIIAARILNEDSDNSETNPAPLNGSRCFVLVKHQILINSTTVKDFFSLYMHMAPQDDFSEIINEYPMKTTGISWLDSLLFRSNKFFRVSWGRDAVIYRVSDNEQTGKLYSSQVKAYEKKEAGKLYYNYEGQQCYSFIIENNSTKLITYYNYDTDESDFIGKYDEVLTSLAKGKITYFDNLPDPFIEVTNSTSLGKSGTFGGYENDIENLLHWEVFSDDNIVEKYPDNDFHLIEFNDTQNLGYCNRREMIEMFHNEDAYSNARDIFLYLDDDGVISKKEMITFYNSPLSENLRYYICQHKSEWTESIDWKSEIESSIGLGREGIWLKLKDFLGIDSLNNLSDYVKYVYDPYKWLSSETVTRMNALEDGNLQQGNATFYHPIQFLNWLYENDEKVIQDFS